MTTEHSPLAELRAEIDRLDDELMTLLAKRYALLPKVVAVKQAHNIPFRVEARVQEVLARNEQAGQSKGLPPGYAHDIYNVILHYAHALEEKMLAK
jgi:chorismate mutase